MRWETVNSPERITEMKVHDVWEPAIPEGGHEDVEGGPLFINDEEAGTWTTPEEAVKGIEEGVDACGVVDAVRADDEVDVR